MRKKSVKKAAALVCIVALAAGIFGCQEKKEEKKTLRVLTDQLLYDKVIAAEKFMEGVDTQIDVEVETLPKDKSERENVVQKLRTEIMSGKGPDVYLMECDIDNIAEERAMLFENPYQTMQGGALASLDEYMEEDSYWDDCTYNRNFLKAGQFDGRQYIIPLSGYYYVVKQTEDMEEFAGDTLWDWLEQGETTSDRKLKMALRSLCIEAGRWMQPAADYENKEVLFDKEEWITFVKQWLTLMENTDELVYEGDDPFILDKVGMVNYEPGTKLLNVPDMNGNKLASVASYGAVSMASDYKKEAYDFIMLFLNNRTYEYYQEGHDMGLPILSGWIDTFGVPLQESAIENWLGFQDDSITQEVIESLRRIEDVYFLTEVERYLNDGVMELNSQRYEASYDIEQEVPKITKIADTAWDTYKKLVTE